MKIPSINAVSKSLKDFDRFIDNEHSEFACNLISVTLAGLTVISIIVGNYVKEYKKGENDYEI